MNTYYRATSPYELTINELNERDMMLSQETIYADHARVFESEVPFKLNPSDFSDDPIQEAMEKPCGNCGQSRYHHWDGTDQNDRGDCMGYEEAK